MSSNFFYKIQHYFFYSSFSTWKWLYFKTILWQNKTASKVISGRKQPGSSLLIALVRTVKTTFSYQTALPPVTWLALFVQQIFIGHCMLGMVIGPKNNRCLDGPCPHNTYSLIGDLEAIIQHLILQKVIYKIKLEAHRRDTWPTLGRPRKEEGNVETSSKKPSYLISYKKESPAEEIADSRAERYEAVAHLETLKRLWTVRLERGRGESNGIWHGGFQSRTGPFVPSIRDLYEAQCLRKRCSPQDGLAL